MKKILKIASLTLAGLIIAALGYTYISFNYYAPADPDVAVDQVKLAYYHESWEECREAFLLQAKTMRSRFNNVETFSIPIESKTDKDLTIDFCYIPASDTTQKLMIINSGTHGIEGFVGSAVQQMLMNDFFEPEMLSEVGLLIIHGMNSWGFKNERRFTENNVDLNRNFDSDETLFQTQNDGFVSLYDMLTPTGKVNMNSLENRFFMLKAINQIAQKGMPALLQAFAQGQYQFQEGIYFGGNEFEQQVSILSKVISEKAAPYQTVLNLDLHTGFGERGTLHLFPNPVEDPELRQKMEKVFDGYPINWGDSDNFYTVSGQFVEYIGELLSDKTSIPMLMEFGTLNTSKTIGSVKSAHVTITENQGAHYGYKSEKDSLKVKAGYYEMFYPPSEKWRTNAITISKEMMESIVKNFLEL
ncbi:M14 family metallopeptidase [Prolixibacteraceae bacterium Z1-6]|uniref:M14 family metallopeptidase n=1 Tax=Draconibacterium aestuarii TaxID=2998507 RepID=A0A9X3J956_9BACT|nr:M14 family metallopeptidase [Prolixibacteraceae bacterium Z1-6]